MNLICVIMYVSVGPLEGRRVLLLLLVLCVAQIKYTRQPQVGGADHIAACCVPVTQVDHLHLHLLLPTQFEYSRDQNPRRSLGPM